MIKLKPCPFCGGKAELKQDTRYPRSGKYEDKAVKAYEVICPNYGCVIYKADNTYFLSKKAAVEAWNSRASGWISVNDRLPKNGQNVLILDDAIYQAEFFTGISKSERKILKENGDERADYYIAGDEYGNNEKPYYWSGVDGNDWFGQDVAFWMPLPELLEVNENDD